MAGAAVVVRAVRALWAAVPVLGRPATLVQRQAHPDVALDLTPHPPAHHPDCRVYDRCRTVTMSDSDDGYSYSDLEYSSEDDGGNDADAGLVEIENTFYDADGTRHSCVGP